MKDSPLGVLLRDEWTKLVGLPPVLALAGLVAYSIGTTGSLPLPVVACALLLVPLAALRHPRGALALGVFAMALPYTWSPNVPKIGGAFGILVGLVLAAAGATVLRGFVMTALDWAVLAFAVTSAPVSMLQGQGLHLTLWLAPATTFPYFGFRFFFHATKARLVFAPAVICVGVATALLGIVETLIGRNPLLPAQTLNTVPGTPQVWDVPLHRNGILRAESTFGHPLAFGMFLLIPLAFAASRPGRIYLLATATILAAELATLSRGPWLGAAAVMLMLSRWNRRRIVIAVLVAAAAVAVVPPLHALILQTGGTSSESGQTANYRLGLLSGAFKHLTFFGYPNTDITSIIPGFADVTSWLATTILEKGVIGLCELLVLLALSIHLVLLARRSGERDFLAAGAAVAGQFVGLVTVTLITSYEFFFWVSLAYLVAAAQEARSQHANGAGASQEQQEDTANPSPSSLPLATAGGI